jgi:3-oxoacyl-[acyl-carrier protein] reductase
MDLGLKNKIVAITGASSGLGLATARAFAAEGAKLAIGSRDPSKLEDAQRQLREFGGEVFASPVDITNAGSAKRWIEDAASHFGGLHVVVTNGSGPPFGGALNFNAEAYRSALNNVFMPVVEMALAAIPHLEAAGWGRLLFITSETVCTPIPDLALSGITRIGIVRFAQALAAQLGEKGITVNVLAPGWMRTPLTEGAAARLAENGDAEGKLHELGSQNAIGRIGSPDEFAAVAAFLASERASFITGTVQLVDGGASILGPQNKHSSTDAKTHLSRSPASISNPYSKS